MTGSTHVFSAFSFIAFILVSIPLPWHLHARTSATCLYILWVSLCNFAHFINSVLWDGNVVDRSPVWCDISTRLIMASHVAFPATSLCIQRCIYNVLSDPPATNATALKQRRLIWNLVIGLAFPLLSIVFAFIVQENRYVIYEDFGCRIEFYRTALAAVLVCWCRLAPGLVNSVYGCLNMYLIWTRGREFRSIYGPSNGSHCYDHYIRLSMLSGIDILITIPFNLWYFSTCFPVIPWPGWNVVHGSWSHVTVIPASEWRSTTESLLMVEFFRWMSVVYGTFFFLFFGVGANARQHYSSAWQYVLRVFCWRTRTPGDPSSLQIDFAVNKHSDSDKSCSFGSSHEISGSIVSEFKAAPPGDLEESSRSSQQYHITPTRMS